MAVDAPLPAPPLPSSGAGADAELVERLRRGDPAGYARLVQEHGGAMLAVARRVLRSESDAEDAVQDALVSVVRSIRAFEGAARLRTWLHRIALNAALMRLRSQRRHRETPLEHDQPAGSPGAATRSEGTEAFESLARAEQLASVRRCLERLPEGLALAVRLRDVEAWEMNAICEVLDIGLSTLKIRLHRGRDLLREMLLAGSDPRPT